MAPVFLVMQQSLAEGVAPIQVSASERSLRSDVARQATLRRCPKLLTRSSSTGSTRVLSRTPRTGPRVIAVGGVNPEAAVALPFINQVVYVLPHPFGA